MITAAKLISELRKTDMYIKDIFTMGGCYRFYLFLKVIYPDAIPYINDEKDHVVTNIGRKLYDIRGVVKKGDGIYSPMTKKDISKARRWSFRKHNLLQVTECPACEEPICV